LVLLCWLIRVGLQLQVDLVQPFIEMLSELLHGLSVNSGSAFVGADASIPLVKVVQTVDFVYQAVPFPHCESLRNSAEPLLGSSLLVAVSSPDFPGVSSTRQSTLIRLHTLLGGRTYQLLVTASQGVPSRIPARCFHSHQLSFALLRLSSVPLRPFVPTPGFWPSAAAHSSVSVPCVLPSQLLPAFIGTGFITTTGSSDAHPALVGLASTLVPALPAPSRRTVMGLPG